MKAFQIFLNERFILGLIIFNAVVLFIQGFDISFAVDSFLFHIDNLITFLFIIELGMKIRSLGFGGFTSSGWNIFDAVLVMLALPSLLLWLFNINTLQLDFLLVLRITRVFKFFRFIRFFPDITSLITGVQRALKASVVVLLGFFVFIFIIAVVSSFLYKNVAPELFGNPIISLYSIFLIFTVEGWNEIPASIAENASATVAGFSKLYFAIILLTGGIFGLSLVNSIFVDAMVSDNNDELERKIERLEKKIDLLMDQTAKNL